MINYLIKQIYYPNGQAMEVNPRGKYMESPHVVQAHRKLVERLQPLKFFERFSFNPETKLRKELKDLADKTIIE